MTTIELNVGGQKYTTTLDTLTFVSTSKLATWFSDPARSGLAKDNKVWILRILFLEFLQLIHFKYRILVSWGRGGKFQL